jgi:diguanylate cyclase (GGDEF)-like protein
MPTPEPLTPEEAARVRSLKTLHILDTPAEERFDRITRLALRDFGARGAAIALVDQDRAWLKSKQGLVLASTPAPGSLCEAACSAADVLVVDDCMQDERFRDDALVAGGAPWRFFAGHPLRDREGRRLGALCVLDRAPRELGPDDLQALRDLAALAQTELRVPPGSDRSEGRERLDEATGAWNRAGTLELLQRQIEGHLVEHAAIAVISMRIENLDELGAARQADGRDLVMAEVAQVIRRCVRAHDAVGRIADDLFLVLLFDTDEHTMSDNARRICTRVSSNLVLGSGLVDIRFGIAGYVPGGPHDAEELVQIATRDLMKAERFLERFPARIAG